VEDASQLVAGVGVRIYRDEAVQVGHHQVSVHQLKQVQHRLRLVLRGPHFQQHTDSQVVHQVNLQNRGHGFGGIPGQDEGGRYRLAGGIPNSEHFRL